MFYFLPYEKSLYDLVIQYMVCFLHLQQFLLHKSSRIPPRDAQVCRDADTSLMLVLTVCTACSSFLLDNNMYPGVSSGFWLSSLRFQLCSWAIVNAEAEKRCDPPLLQGWYSHLSWQEVFRYPWWQWANRQCFCLFSHKVLMNKWGRGIKKLMLWEEIWVYQLLLGGLNFTWSIKQSLPEVWNSGALYHK